MQPHVPLGKALSVPFWTDSAQAREHIPELSATDFEVDKSSFLFPEEVQQSQGRKAVFKVQSENWSLDEWLGKGTYGETYLATYARTGRRYVVKFLNSCTDRELNILRKIPYSVFQHQNLCQYVGIAENVSDVFPGNYASMVFMEAIPNGDLFNLLVNERNSDNFSEASMRRFTRDIIKGMSFLAQNRVTHSDLKPENLLIDGKARVIIIDLGSAKMHDLCTGAESSLRLQACGQLLLEHPPSLTCGSCGYYPPEYKPIGELEHTRSLWECEAADVWTVGMIILLMRRPTDPAWIRGKTFEYITPDGLHETRWQQIEASGVSYSDELKSLLNTMLRKSPEHRPSWADLDRACDKESPRKELKWLSLPVSEPLRFFQELKAHNPRVVNKLNSTGAVEALVQYVRSFGEGGSSAAFKAAKLSNTDTLSTSELQAAMKKKNINITGRNDDDDDELSLASLMLRYIDSEAMALREFQAMWQVWQEWSSVDHPVVPICGRRRSRCHAWNLSPLGLSAEAECQQFVDALNAAVAKEGLQYERAPVEAENAARKDDGLFHICFTIEEVSCQLRCNVFVMESKIILESKVRWGSAVEELGMLKKVDKAINEKWGQRVKTPTALTEDWIRPAMLEAAQAQPKDDLTQRALMYALKMISQTMDVYGEQFADVGRIAEKFIVEPPGAMWLPAKGQSILQELKDPTKCDPNKYYAACHYFREFVAQETAYQAGVAQQKDGHQTVVLKNVRNGTPVALVPNGEVLIILLREEDSYKVKWTMIEGWAKITNVVDIESAKVWPTSDVTDKALTDDMKAHIIQQRDRGRPTDEVVEEFGPVFRKAVRDHIQQLEALEASLCPIPGCSRPGFRTTIPGPCCRRCAQTAGKDHGPSCEQSDQARKEKMERTNQAKKKLDERTQEVRLCNQPDRSLLQALVTAIEEAKACGVDAGDAEKVHWQATQHLAGVAQQVDGHPTVVLRRVPDGDPVVHVPNGESLQILERQSDNVKVRWKTWEGWAKATNVSWSDEGISTG